MPTAAMVSFRLGGSDGVSVEAAKWSRALGLLGWEVHTVAGSGPVDVVLEGLSIGAPTPPTRVEVENALASADLVIVENLCSLPLNPAAAAVVAAVCAGRPTLLHHHDLPWQRAHLAHFPPPPTDAVWAHVTINGLSQRELAERGIAATVLYNSFDPNPVVGARDETRAALGVAASDRLFLQPTRALPRKNVAEGLRLAETLGATFWLLGPAEDGYGPELDVLVDRAQCPVLLGSGNGAISISDAYAACDVVVLPSTWEGFGNPSVESATYRKPLAIGSYPVADELLAFGFEWFPSGDPAPLGAWLNDPDAALLEHNHAIAASAFNEADLPARLQDVFDRMRTSFG